MLGSAIKVSVGVFQTEDFCRPQMGVAPADSRLYELSTTLNVIMSPSRWGEITLAGRCVCTLSRVRTRRLLQVSVEEERRRAASGCDLIAAAGTGGSTTTY